MQITPCVYYNASLDPNRDGVECLAIKLDTGNGIPRIWGLYLKDHEAIKPDAVTLGLTLEQARQIFDIMSAEEYRQRQGTTPVWRSHTFRDEPSKPATYQVTAFMAEYSLTPDQVKIVNGHDGKTVWYFSPNYLIPPDHATFAEGDEIIWCNENTARRMSTKDGYGPFTVTGVIEIPDDLERNEAGHHQWLVVNDRARRVSDKISGSYFRKT